MTKDGSEIANGQKSRNRFIDFLRGLAILDMIAVHYAHYFPKLISKIIIYHDIAIEGFLFLAGFMVGWHYMPRFKEDGKGVTKRLITRAVKLILLQYIMVISLGVPQFLVNSKHITLNSTQRFLIDSFTFSNQIGLLHILPTFIPLFIISPIILFFFSKRLDTIVGLTSIAAFWVGQYDPYIFNYGEKTIFPVILWQIYFVSGAYIGKVVREKDKKLEDVSNLFLTVSTVLLILALTLKHASTLSKIVEGFKEQHNIIIQKFPLNDYGLAYGVVLWLFVYSISSKLWNWIENTSLVHIVVLFGRNSLLVFVIHVYFAKLLEIMGNVTNIFKSVLLANCVIVLNVYVTLRALKKYEGSRNANLSRAVRWLF